MEFRKKNRKKIGNEIEYVKKIVLFIYTNEVL